MLLYLSVYFTATVQSVEDKQQKQGMLNPTQESFAVKHTVREKCVCVCVCVCVCALLLCLQMLIPVVWTDCECF